jgi:hypothetical protein
MGIRLGCHHLVTYIQLKVSQDYVLTGEWQTAKNMYPIFVMEMRKRTKVEPVLEHNFSIHLRKLCEEGVAESKDGDNAKLFRRKNG